MRGSLPVAWLFPLVVAVTSADGALFAPAKGLKVEKQLSASFELALDVWSVEMDGKEVPREYLPELEVQNTQAYTLSLTDEHLQASSGKPVELRRTFGELKASAKHDATVNGASLEGSGERKGTSKLDGCAVHYRADGTTKLEKGECDPKLVAQVPIDLDLAGLVAGASKEPWKADAQAFNPLGFGVEQIDLDWDKPEGEEHAPRKQLIDNLRGEWRLTLGETRKAGEQELLVIAIEGRFDTHTSRDTKLEHIPGLQGAAVETCEMQLSAKGELLWDPVQHVAARATISVDRKASFKTVRVPDASDPRPYKQVMNFSGPAKFTFAATVARG